MSGIGRPDLHAVAAALDQLGPGGRVTIACYLAIAVGIVVDLVASAPRRGRLGRGRALSLTATITIAIVLALPFAEVLGAVWSRVGDLAPAALTRLWTAHPIAGFVACFVVVDAVAYLYHWVGHRTRVGWASHRVHHLAESFDMTLVLRQPWFPVHGLVIVPLTALGGFSFATAAVCSAISIAYQALQHTSRSWSLGRLESVLMSGRAHRHHHVVDGGAVNLGAVLTVWDKAFDTWVDGAAETGAKYGTGRPEPVNPLELQLGGWRRPAPTDDVRAVRVLDGGDDASGEGTVAVESSPTPRSPDTTTPDRSVDA